MHDYMHSDASNQRPRFVGYVRVSTARQEENGSLEAQAERIRQWAVARGMQPVSIHAETASGRGSVDEIRRPVLHEAFREARQLGLPLVVTKADRLFRNVAEAEGFMRQCGVPVISIGDGGEISEAVLLATVRKGECSVNNIVRGTVAALEGRREAGVALGSRGDNKAAARASARVRSDKAHALVQRIARFLGEDPGRQKLTDAELAEALNHAGIYTGRNRPWTVPALRRPRRSALEILRMEAEPDDDNPYKDNPNFGRF
ncbi:recombinase family protein (plasmid) [Cereibacter azotoformans]|uniref:DNA invertase Pin-like site-specific DNA recombinase n=1 Tax=Cereibacter azotoformans TaxID=43057 RepID=A0A2T5JPY6_9RHOB|nr:recombinase family protein [Cereibacter azotoformans]AXQ96291.1 recombinase family protein [Cereibacter sphaeroides]MBO4170782.1 recombinase family protein [Cereibacter azotoformans]PTR09900.1 DNA invertase Pin-like site-specific DNA recombinase [Cereibacter azotoformans]UIJ33288.1 recombinase family protein [Cereibacter azotoformans]